MIQSQKTILRPSWIYGYLRCGTETWVKALASLTVEREMFLALLRYFEVILMSKWRLPPISRYENVKTWWNYNNATKIVSSFTYPIMIILHQPTTKLHYTPLCNTITIMVRNSTYHLIAIRHVAANKYIQKFWKQTTARDVSLCHVIITFLYYLGITNHVNQRHLFRSVIFLSS